MKKVEWMGGGTWKVKRRLKFTQLDNYNHN